MVVVADPDSMSTSWRVQWCCENEHGEWWCAVRCAQRSLASVRIIDQSARPERHGWRYWCTAVDAAEL